MKSRGMIREYSPFEFLQLSEKQTVIDVRSPGEYMQGHIPGALNVPLFNDAERAVIGTIYTKTGSEKAISRGYEIANPKIESFLQAVEEAGKGSGKALVHCWRGGMRSGNMARLFSDNGYETGVLTGGYKAYRTYIREQFAMQVPVVVVGGYTGCGKTEILQLVKSQGEQVIDLEEMAHHKGSVFGALGQPAQPTNEQFENDLSDSWRKFDLTKPVWLEDESRMIGNVSLPDPVIRHLSSGILIRLDMPAEGRIRRLVAEYAGFSRESLTTVMKRLEERLGGTRLRDAVKAIESGDFEKAAGIALQYYDKAYDFAINRRAGQKIIHFRVDLQPTPATAIEIIQTVRKALEDENHLS